MVNYHDADLIPIHIRDGFDRYHKPYLVESGEYGYYVQQRWDSLVDEYCEESILNKINELESRLDNYKNKRR